MKKLICIIMAVCLLTTGVKVKAAPAAALLVPIAGAIAMMSYMGVETIVKGADSDIVQQQLGQMLLEYAAYKGTTIAELFPEGALTFSLGRLVCSTLGWNNLLDFAQWLMTGDDEGPLVDKVLYARENLLYNGKALRRSFESPVEAYDISAGKTCALYVFATTAAMATTSASEVFKESNLPKLVYGYWWIGVRYVNSQPKIYGFTIQDVSAGYGKAVSAIPYLNQTLMAYGNTSLNWRSAYTTTSTTINDKTWYVNYVLLGDKYEIPDSDILGSETDVLGGISVDEESISVEGDLKYPTKEEDGEIVPDITEGAVVGIPDLPLDQTGDRAAETVIDLVTDAPLDTTKYVDNGGANEPTIPPVADMGLSGLETIFPFSLPFDIYYLVHSFRGEPVAPVVDIPLNVPGLGNYTLQIDLSAYNEVAEVLRVVELLPIILGLIILTNRVVR